MIERLINQIEDRLETHKCLVSYSGSPDKSLYLDAVKRYEEFSRYAKEDVTKWTDRQMWIFERKALGMARGRLKQEAQLWLTEGVAENVSHSTFSHQKNF